MFEEVEEIDRRWVYYLDIPGGPDEYYQHHSSLGLGHIRRFAETKTPEASSAMIQLEREIHFSLPMLLLLYDLDRDAFEGFWVCR